MRVEGLRSGRWKPEVGRRWLEEQRHEGRNSRTRKDRAAAEQVESSGPWMTTEAMMIDAGGVQAGVACWVQGAGGPKLSRRCRQTV